MACKSPPPSSFVDVNLEVTKVGEVLGRTLVCVVFVWLFFEFEVKISLGISTTNGIRACIVKKSMFFGVKKIAGSGPKSI